jgi:hypothetical protein
MEIARVRIGKVKYRRDAREGKPFSMLQSLATENGEPSHGLWQLNGWEYQPGTLIRIDTFVRR